MKISALFFILSAAMLASGCYTQLALNNDEAEAKVASEPLPVVIIVEPIFVPISSPYYPPPTVGVTAPTPKTWPDNKRDIGNQRGPSSSDTRPRDIGSRGGR